MDIAWLSQVRKPVSHIPLLAIHTNATRRPFIYSQSESSAAAPAGRKGGATNSLPSSLSPPPLSRLITCCLLGPPRLELELNRKGRQIISVRLVRLFAQSSSLAFSLERIED